MGHPRSRSPPAPYLYWIPALLVLLFLVYPEVAATTASATTAPVDDPAAPRIKVPEYGYVDLACPSISKTIIKDTDYYEPRSYSMTCGISMGRKGDRPIDIVVIMSYSLVDCLKACSSQARSSRAVNDTSCNAIQFSASLFSRDSKYGGNCFLKRYEGNHDPLRLDRVDTIVSGVVINATIASTGTRSTLVSASTSKPISSSSSTAEISRGVDNAEGSGLSKDQKIALGVGIPAAVISLFTLGAMFYRSGDGGKERAKIPRGAQRL